MDAFASFLLIPLVFAGGVLIVKAVDQAHSDNHRKAYRLSFPPELDEDRVVSWVRAISGALRPRWGRFTGSPAIAFELWATNRGITYRLKVPSSETRYVIDQLRTLIPGIRVVPDDDPPRTRWTTAVEVGLTNSSRTLRIYSASDTAASVLASVANLDDGEVMVVQLVATSARPVAPPVQDKATTDNVLSLKTLLNGLKADNDEVKDRRTKLEEPNMLAVLRVGTVAKTSRRAKDLLDGVRHALAATQRHSTRFVRRLVPRDQLQERIDTAAGSVMYPMKLAAGELAAIVGWPIGQPHVAGLPRGAARHLAPTEDVARTGRVVARSNFPGNERLLAISQAHSLMHMWIVGGTGVGKTTLMENLFAQDVHRGHGAIVIEKSGNFFRHALDAIPRERMDDVIVLDVMDSQYPVGFNVLAQGNPQLVASNLKQLFNHIFGRGGVRFPESLYHGVMTLMKSTAATEPAAFTDLMPLFIPRTASQELFAEAIARGVAHDEMLDTFWQRLRNYSRDRRDVFAEPILDRLWELCARPEVSNIIGQSYSAFNIYDAIQERKILLVNLAGLGDETASILGSLIMLSLWDAVVAGAANPAFPTYLYLDEFQEFLNLPIAPDMMLAQARKYGLAMHLAHQQIGQLTTPMLSAIMANARSKVVFQTSAIDARALVREYGSLVSEADFTQLRNYEVICRLMGADGVSDPVTGITLPPPRRVGLGKQIRERSRKRYAKPVAQVEAEIRGRRERAADSMQNRQNPPKIGETKWE